MINLLSRLAKDSIGHFDWSPYVPLVFSKILRGLGLSLAAEFSLNINDNTPKEALSLINTISESFAYGEEDVDSLGSWIVNMIGNTAQDRGMCLKHLKILFKMLRSYYNPSNTGNLVKYSLLKKD